MNNDVAAFGLRLRACRRSAGLSQEELAERSGLSVRTISNLERDRTRQPHPDSVRRLADALQLRDQGRAQFIAVAGLRNTVAPDAMTLDDRLSRADYGHVVPRQLPAPVRPFAGRGTELRQLTALLDDTDAAKPAAMVISVIEGTAGVGKTALAVHWAHQATNRFPDGQLYVNLRGFDPSRQPMSSAEAIRDLLDALEVPARRIPASLEAQAALYRSLLAGKRMLVVLDNARRAQQVRLLLPGSPGCLVMITSRSQLTGLVAAEGAHVLSLNLLTEAEAHELLALRLGAARMGADPEAAVELVRLCARLPLALAITAARAAARPGLTLGALAGELKDTRQILDTLDAGDPLASVRTVFSWSLKHLAAPASRMFGLLGLHPGPDITIPAAASFAGMAPRQVRETLRELAAAHLVNEHLPGRYAMHDLLRAYAGEQTRALDGEADRQAAIRRMLDHYLHTARAADRLLKPTRSPIALDPPEPGTAPEALSGPAQAMAWFLAEQQVLSGMAEYAHAAGCTGHAWKLPWTMSVFLDFRGDWQQMAAVHHMALAAARGADDKSGQAHAHVNLARACMRLGRTDDGLGHLEHALALHRQMESPVGQGRAHLSLALALDTEGRYDEAFSHNRQALSLLSQAGDHAGRADALSSVGWSQALRGNYAEALACCLQAIKLQRQSGNRYGEAHTLDSIAYVHRHLGQHDQAVTCYEQSASLFSELGDRYYEADALINLGDTFGASGGRQMARDAWQKALDILDDLNHPRAAEVRERLQADGIRLSQVAGIKCRKVLPGWGDRSWSFDSSPGAL